MLTKEEPNVLVKSPAQLELPLVLTFDESHPYYMMRKAGIARPEDFRVTKPPPLCLGCGL